ncbi:hypothetical protein [Bradyrhizobium sp. USDA 10063]
MNCFTQAGLSRRIGPNGWRSFFDTNTTHPHYDLHDLPEENILLDIREGDRLIANARAVAGATESPAIDLVINLRRKPSRSSSAHRKAGRRVGLATLSRLRQSDCGENYLLFNALGLAGTWHAGC